MSNPNIHLLAIALLAGLSQPAFAIGTAPPDAAPAAAESAAKPPPSREPSPLPAGAKSATKLELDALRTQNALAAERAKALGAANGISAGPTVPAADARPIDVEATPGRGGAAANSARVTMVAGPVGQLAATIMTARGLVVARAGDRVPGLGTIRAIAVNQVLVEDGKQTVSLPFAAEPAGSLIQGGAPMPGGGGMPGAGLTYGGR
ncbi:hypothetical protein [Propionivibrio sp.]|uniref:hypothetical protein n=1 Tax=Propionivibrio sp. TaxID=2212460 RepID=UPI0039E5D8D7